MKDPNEYYEQIESLLWEAVELIEGTVSEKEYQLAAEFIEHAEYGLAADELDALVMDKGLEYPEPLKSAREMMGLDSEE